MKWLAIVAIWAVLGVIYAAPIYIEVRAAQHGHMAWRIFSWGILTWLAWAPLTPAIVWLARRYSLVLIDLRSSQCRRHRGPVMDSAFR
jgi:hypothetical protein